MDTFDYSEKAFDVFPILEGIKDAILAEEFDEALKTLFAVFMWLQDYGPSEP